MPEAISGLVKNGLVRQVGATDDEQYLPRAASFSLINNPKIAADAQNAATMVLHVLQDLYRVELDKRDFSYEDVLRHAKERFKSADAESVKFGLYLCQDLNVFTSWTCSNTTMEVASARLAERIVTIDPEAEWDENIERTNSRGQTSVIPSASVSECQYLDYPLYPQPLNTSANQSPEKVLDIKPSFWGITLNVNALLKRLGIFWETGNPFRRATIIALGIGLMFCLGWTAVHVGATRQVFYWFSPQAEMPTITLRIENPAATETLIISRGEFLLFFPQGVAPSAPTVPGAYQLTATSNDYTQDGYIILKPRTATILKAMIMNQDAFAPLLKRGDSDLTFVFRTSGGRVFMSETIPFEVGSIKRTVLADCTQE